jgi:hypothetical protein
MRNITNIEPPAKHLVFLLFFWATWSEYRNIRSKDGRERPCDLREWLQWLESLASHPLSRRVLNLLTSNCEVWLSKISSEERYGYDEDKYLPWISSLPWRYQFPIRRVSHPDWEHAKRVAESAVAQDLGTMEGGVSGSQDPTIEFCEMPLVVALYLCSFPNTSGGFQVRILNDIGRIKSFIQYWDFECPPILTPTPAMIKFRSVLQTAHPTCCHRLGPTIIDWYSACIALLGLAGSVDHSRWGCKHCISCKATSSFHTYRKLSSGSKQHLFDGVVRNLVSAFYRSPKGPLFLLWIRQRLPLRKV